MSMGNPKPVENTLPVHYPLAEPYNTKAYGLSKHLSHPTFREAQYL